MFAGIDGLVGADLDIGWRVIRLSQKIIFADAGGLVYTRLYEAKTEKYWQAQPIPLYRHK